MSKEKLSDKEIADGILVEVELTMQRIKHAHEEYEGELKSDAYSRMQEEGWWNAKKILDEYVSVMNKKSCLPANLRQMIVVIFETASTNFWAKQIKKENDNRVKKQTKKKK